MIEFHLEKRSGVPTYLQVVQQVRQAVRLGILQPGDQLPTVKEVVAQLTINPNTVLRAYGQLDMEGLVEGRRGVGTFVAEGAAPPPPDDREELRPALQKWINRARSTGLDEDAIATMFDDTLRPPAISRVA
ncbi:MAG TPA: GntR family transcriptional regulator [Gaiellaceae bacterium]|nr:GntR family transcriptional regulator [Gaiellaceae bacterium]